MAAVRRSRRARRSATGGAGGFGQGRTDGRFDRAGGAVIFPRMAKQGTAAKRGKRVESAEPVENTPPPTPPSPSPSRPGRPSSLLDTRVVYCGDNLEQLKKLPDRCVDLIYIDPALVSAVDPPFNSNRTVEQLGEVFWGETKEKRSFEDRHASTAAYIDYMRPRCVELASVLKKTGLELQSRGIFRARVARSLLPPQRKFQAHRRVGQRGTVLPAG